MVLKCGNLLGHWPVGICGELSMMNLFGSKIFSKFGKTHKIIFGSKLFDSKDILNKLFII